MAVVPIAMSVILLCMKMKRNKRTPPTAYEREKLLFPVGEHGIACVCEPCLGLRLYPVPSYCHACKRTHPGNAHNCQKIIVDNRDSNGSMDWSEQSQLVETATVIVTRYCSEIREALRKEGGMSLKGMLDAKKNGDGGNLLHGTDVPKKTSRFSVKITAVREAPENFTAPLIIDIDEVYGCSGWAVNKTNTKALIELFGDDEKKMIGKKLWLEVVSMKNPSSNKVGPTLIVSARQ